MARKTAQQRRIERLINEQTGPIQRAFSEAMAKASGAIDRAALLRLLQQGDIERAIQLFRIDRGVLFPIEEAIRNAYIGGGLSVAKDLPKGIAGRFGFDGSHPRAVTWAREMAANLVTYTSEENIAAARAVITEGLNANRGLNSVAQDLAGRVRGGRRVGGITGLTEQQTDRMINLRSMLQDPDRIGEYFNGKQPRYVESDRRFDARVRRAIKEGRALSSEDVGKIAEAYKRKATGRRAGRVAQHEARVNISAGRDEGYVQLLDNPEVETATVRWQHNKSPNARANHVDVDGEVITVGETFSVGGVSMKYPHDPAGGIANSAGCKCTGIYRVRFKRD
jgi:hypothetical protein